MIRKINIDEEYVPTSRNMPICPICLAEVGVNERVCLGAAHQQVCLIHEKCAERLEKNKKGCIDELQKESTPKKEMMEVTVGFTNSDDDVIERSFRMLRETNIEWGEDFLKCHKPDGGVEYFAFSSVVFFRSKLSK